MFQRLSWGVCLMAVGLLASACGSGASDDPGGGGGVAGSGAAGVAGSGGSAAGGGGGSGAGGSGVGGSTGSSGSAGAGTAGSGIGGAGGAAGAAGTAGGGAATCAAAKAQLLKPVDSVSSGTVTVLAEDAGKKTVFIDASAGGSQMATANPRVYVNLEQAKRVDVTDDTAATSTGWDLAIKRPILFTNGGDGGIGLGRARLVDKDFDAITAADATSLLVESFFEVDCTPRTDTTGAVKTTFDGWYDYDMASMTLSPHPGTWIVRGGTGKLYKLRILSYYANADGSQGMSGGRYKLEWKAL